MLSCFLKKIKLTLGVADLKYCTHIFLLQSSMSWYYYHFQCDVEQVSFLEYVGPRQLLFMSYDCDDLEMQEWAYPLVFLSFNDRALTPCMF